METAFAKVIIYYYSQASSQIGEESAISLVCQIMHNFEAQRIHVCPLISLHQR